MTTRYMPTEIIAGNTFSLGLTLTDYSSDSWTLCLSLRGPMPIDVDADPEGTGFIIQIPYTDTRQYPAGLYQYVLYVSSLTEQYSIETGEIDVVLRTDLIRTTDVRTSARRILDAIEATLENRATNDQLSYTINGRSLERTPLLELLELQRYYKEVVNKSSSSTGTSRYKVKSVMQVI